MRRDYSDGVEVPPKERMSTPTIAPNDLIVYHEFYRHLEKSTVAYYALLVIQLLLIITGHSVAQP